MFLASFSYFNASVSDHLSKRGSVSELELSYLRVNFNKISCVVALPVASRSLLEGRHVLLCSLYIAVFNASVLFSEHLSNLASCQFEWLQAPLAILLVPFFSLDVTLAPGIFEAIVDEAQVHPCRASPLRPM